MMYFDHNATTPLLPRAREAWLEACEQSWQNPSSPYRDAVRVKTRLRLARERLAGCLGVNPETIVFCSGSTEATNLWIRNFFEHPHFAGQNLLVSRQEHACVFNTVKRYGSGRINWFSPDSEHGEAQVRERIESDERPGGVVLMAANNETGDCYAWREVARVCREAGIPFFCDTSQWLGKMPLQGLENVDYFCGSAHKFGGPKGVGFLKTSRRFPDVTGLSGGGQEGGLRSGTEDYPGIIAMVEALEFYCAEVGKPEATDERYRWREDFLRELNRRLPGVSVAGGGGPVLWNTIQLILPKKRATVWVEKLDREGVAVGVGSACATSGPGHSRILDDLNYPREQAERAIRISSGWSTSRRDWEQLIEILFRIYRSFDDADDGGLTEVISIDSL